MDDNNQHISHTTTASSEGISNSCTEPNVLCATIRTNMSQRVFDVVLINLKTEYGTLLNNESIDSEDFTSIAYGSQSIDNENENQPQDGMYELASTSNENDVNVSESNSQEFTDTELVNGEITSMHTSSSPSTALPITQILLPKSKLHTCLECCFLCQTVFRVLDTPSHICQIRSIAKQNEFLKIGDSLCVDSCLCDFCWKYLEKTYKSNKPKNIKKEEFKEKRARLQECHWKKKKKKNQTRICSIHSCSRRFAHKLTVNAYENINKILSTFEFCRLVFAQSTKKTIDHSEYPFCLCLHHTSMIKVISTCQICGENLNEPLNTNDWSMYQMWNQVLLKNKLSLTLRPGMFICVTCKGYISKENPGFPTIDLPRFEKNICMSRAIRLQLYGESKNNLFDTCEESFIVPKIKEEKRVHSTKVKFSEPLITATFNYEIDYYENDTESITKTALLYVTDQNLLTPKLEPKDEVVYSVELEEEHFKEFAANKSKYQLHNINTDPTPNTNSIEITNSLNKIVDDSFGNILYEQNSYATTNHVIHDNSRDLLQLCADHQLKNDSKISKNEEINQYSGIVNNNSLQNLYQVDNVEIHENELEIIDSHQVVGYDEIENQNKLNIHAICSVAQDRSSVDLKEVNQCMNEINTIHKSVYLNETDKSIYSYVAASVPPNAIINPVSTKRKLSNFITDTSSKKDLKKQRLNEKYKSYEINSTDSNTTKPYENINIAQPSINSPNILNRTSNCKNKYFLNSDFIRVQNVTSDVDEESLKKLHSKSIKDIELNTNVPSIHVENAYSLDSSCSRSPLQFKRVLNKKKKPFNGKMVKNYLLDKDIISDSESLPDSIVLSDSEIIVSNTNIPLDSEVFSETDSENILSDCEIEETDYMTVRSEGDLNSESEFEIKPNGENILECSTALLDSVKDSNSEILSDGVKESECIIVSDAKTESNSDELSQCMFISDTEKEFNNKILFDEDKIVETASWSNKGMIKYRISSEYDLTPLGVVRSTCVIISDNDEEFNKKKEFCTFKICIPKGSVCKILLDGETVVILTLNKNRLETKRTIRPDEESESSDYKKSNCIIILDNEEEFINKNLSTFKIVSNDQEESDSELSMDGEKVYEIESNSENRKIKYMIISNDILIGPSSNMGSQYIISPDNEDNKKCTYEVLVKNVPKGSDSILLDGEMSDNKKELNYKKISDIIMTPNRRKHIIDHSQGLKTLNNNYTINNSKIGSKKKSSKLQIKPKHLFPRLELIENGDNEAEQKKNQEYFKDYFLAIQFYFKNCVGQSMKDLYSYIGNENNILMYLLENFRMFYNKELVISETANEFSANYLKEQRKTLNDFFGDPKDSINASKPFIHPSSHLYRCSRRLSSDI